MSNKLNILLLADGASFHTERFVAEIKNQGHTITLLSLEKGTIDQKLLVKKGQIKSLHYFRSVAQIKDVIEKIKPDILSAHFASGYGFSAALANRTFKIPLVLNLWGSDILIVPHKSFMHRWKTNYALKNANFIVADSIYLIDSAMKLYRFDKYAVIPWGIEQRHLKKQKQSYDLSSPLKIIVPRPHEAVYNNLFIIKALKSLLSDGQIEIAFPNFGSQLSSFKKECQKLKGVKFYDKLDRNNFISYMADHDVYLSASKSDSSPVSQIEAMALGMIPVAADIKGVREWLTKNSGFPYEENNSKALYEIINKLSTTGLNYSEMRRANIEKVQKEALFEKNISDQLELMNKLVANGR